jgi:hypothetical protein
VDQKLEACCPAGLLLAIPGTKPQASLGVDALSSAVRANYTKIIALETAYSTYHPTFWLLP